MIPSPALQERAKKIKACIYYIRSLKSGKFYLGSTTNLYRRFNQHNDNKSQYTKNKGPWELIACELFLTYEEAKKREHVLKRNLRMLRYFKKRALASCKDSTAFSCGESR